MSPAQEDPVGIILRSIPALKSLDISATSTIYAYLHNRIQKLNLKIRRSPYAPLERLDPFRVNTNFPDGFCQWLDQFPETYRLGFLLSILSTVYIAQDEMQIFMQAAMARLEDAIKANEGTTSLNSTSGGFRLYPVSEFREFEDVIHRMGLTGTRDRDTRPFRGTVEELVYDYVAKLRTLAEQRQEFIYYDETADAVEQLIKSFLDAHIVLVEDSSYSGTRLLNSAPKFLQMMNVLFGKYEHWLKGSGHRFPYVYLVVLFGTQPAWDAAAEIKEMAGLGPMGERFSVIFGFTFEGTDSSRIDLPENLMELQTLIPTVDLHKELVRAVDFFKTQYFHGYLDETSIEEATRTNLEEIKWGFGGKGWSIVKSGNCANDSLPLLWYPHVESSCKAIKALFPRVEAHKDHSDKAGTFRENLDTAVKDRQGLLKTFLSRQYESLR